MMFAKSIKSYCPLQKLQHKNASYFKTKSVRKLSGFNLQWTKTFSTGRNKVLYRNIICHVITHCRSIKGARKLPIAETTT